MADAPFARKAEAVLDVAIFGAAVVPMLMAGVALGAVGVGAQAGLALLDRLVR